MDEIAKIGQTGEIVTVTLRRDADYSVVSALLDTFEQSRARPGVRRIVVDVAAVRFMDSTALGAFVAAYRFARQDGLTFEVVNPAPNIRRVLEMTGVAHILATG